MGDEAGGIGEDVVVDISVRKRRVSVLEEPVEEQREAEEEGE